MKIYRTITYGFSWTRLPHSLVLSINVGMSEMIGYFFSFMKSSSNADMVGANPGSTLFAQILFMGR